jgi:hypothetical protein
VPEFIDPVFAKTRPKRSFSMTENERFGLVLAKTGSINSGTGLIERFGGMLPLFLFILSFYYNTCLLMDMLYSI